MQKHARLVVGAVVGALALLAAACGDDDEAGTVATSAAGSADTTAEGSSAYPPIPDGPIKLGVSAPLTGANAAFGGAVKKAFEEVTLTKFNEFHPEGIDGHPVEIVVLDDGSDVTKAVNVANQFVSDEVVAMVTLSYNPAATLQQIAIFNEAKIPMLANRGDKDLTDTSKWPYFFGVNPSNPQLEAATAQWIAAHPEIETIGVLTDNSPSNVELRDGILAALETAAPSVTVAETASVSPGAVDVSTAVAQLKDADPDLLYVNLGYAYGPVWQALAAADWSPKVLTSAGAWYDGFDAMGDLAPDAVTAYYTCVEDGHEPFSPELTGLMDTYATVFGTTSINYLTFVSSDSIPLELLKVAIETNHSTDPDAIKDALESMGSTTFFGALTYEYSTDNHHGITGDLGAAVCSMAPFSDGDYRIPFVAS